MSSSKNSIVYAIVNSISPVAIENDHGELGTDEMDTVKSFSKKFVEMNKISSIQSSRHFLRYKRNEKEILAFLPIDLKEL